jgi:hypothetical protein
LVRRFFRLAYPGWQSFPRAPRGRQRRPPISTDSLLERMDSDFRFLIPVTRPSDRHGRRVCCLGKGERIWCGTEGSNPSLSSEESANFRFLRRAIAREDYPGAMVASLRIPWGDSGNERGGYYLVWPRLGRDPKLRSLSCGSVVPPRCQFPGPPRRAFRGESRICVDPLEL